MNVKRTLGIFVSGFVAYGLIATCIVAARGPSKGVLAGLVDPVPTAAADSGSRLKATFLLGEDGTKDYQINTDTTLPKQYGAVYWDSQRNEECAFHLAADGVSRCLPVDRTWYSYYPNISYSDASCTQGVILFPAAKPGCPQVTTKYATSDELDPVCSAILPGAGPRHYYPVGAFVGPNAPCYSKGADNMGPCVPVNCGSGAYYALGAEIDPTSFVGSTHVTDP